MNSFQKLLHKKRGSALITVVMLTAMFAILTASMLTYSTGERRGNERNRLILRAKNMAENIALYSAEQLIPKLNRMGSAPVGVFPWTGSSANRVYMPPNVILNTGFTSSSVGMEMRAGIESASPYALVNDVTSPNNGLQVSTAKIPIIAKATASHPSMGSVSAYTEQDMQLSLTPLFQFGMFYNMDLELFPGQNMSIAGPVHTNNRLTARGEQGSTATVTFTHRVTAAGGLYADGQMKATYVKRDGSTSAGAGGTGAVYYTPVSGASVNLQSSGGVWRDHKYGAATESTTTQNQFRTFTTTTYGGNVRTNAHGVSKLELPGVGSYNETNLPTTAEDDRNSGRQIIEPRNPYKWNGTSWAVDTDDTATKELKFARKAGLYIIVNPDDTARIGKLPDGTDQPILPRSYRAWLNIINADATHTLREVVLPGQPSYGHNDGGTPGSTAALMADDTMYSNVLPNRYTNGTAVGSNQVLRTVQTAYQLGSGYLINNGGGYAIGATDLALDTGTGLMRAGDTVTIGAYHYLVAADQTAAGVIKLAPPGLREVIADNTAVTVAPFGLIGSAAGGTNFQLVGGHTAGNTVLFVDNTAGQSILPGNSITVGASPNARYLVTCAPVATPASTTLTIGIATGLRAGGSYGDNATVVTDPLSGSLGTAKGYQVAFPYGAGINNLMLDTGTGTIQPGNRLYIEGNTYLVAALPTGGVSSGAVTILPALSAAIVDDTLVTVDPLPNTGYYVSGGSGDNFPAEASGASYPAEAYFFDMRRANGNVGYNSNIAGGSARGTANYVPRAIAKIDFDMARFKMMFNRTVNGATTSTGYNVGAPTATNWANSIFNPAGTAVALDLGVDADNAAAFAYTSFPGSGTPETVNRPDPFRLYYTPAYLTPSTPGLIPADPGTLAVPAADLASAWYDGIAVYIHSVDAERRAQTIVAGKNDRVDSGVRLTNGRGPLASYTTAAKTGLSFATNDAAYIIGHYNADGTINATSTDNTNPGGYSATYPDTANEKLAAVMADAITLLSQPVFSSASTPYYQTNGWNDAVSAFRITNTSWAATWRSAAPSTSNNYEGLGTSATAIKPGALPTSSTPGTGGTTTWQTKLPPPAATEFSTALLMGMVPSNHNATGLTDRPPISAANAQYSGGAHNFPRLLEDWHSDLDASISGNANLYIRGSMVALFESRVAMEPWNIRCYAAPNRYWGLHYGFTQANHDVPLEPLVIGADRLGFRELTAADYATRKTFLESLTTIP
ncbi:MAG: hypothetical protein HYX71_11240 [Opitutae bacterium]|nr:hypothetical protein [Opitutae bacterium]